MAARPFAIALCIALFLKLLLFHLLLDREVSFHISWGALPLMAAATVLLLSSGTWLFHEREQLILLLCLDVGLSVVLLADLLYFRFSEISFRFKHLLPRARSPRSRTP